MSVRDVVHARVRAIAAEVGVPVADAVFMIGIMEEDYSVVMDPDYWPKWRRFIGTIEPAQYRALGQKLSVLLAEVKEFGLQKALGKHNAGEWTEL